MQAAATGVSPVLRTDVELAGFSRRVVAYLIDSVVLFGVAFIVYTGARILAPDDVDVIANVGAVCAAIAWAYYVLMESSPARGTIGKLALGLYVSDAHGDPITFWRAGRRNAYKVLSTFVFGLGWLLAAVTPRKQALHDVLAGTLVLRRVNYFVIGRETPTEPGDHWDGTRWVASVPPQEGS